MPDIIKNIKKYFGLTRSIHIGVILSLLLALVLTYILPGMLNKSSDNKLLILCFIIFLLLIIFVPIYFVYHFIKKTFSDESEINKLIIILHSYLGIIVIFASLYFSFIVIGDFTDQRDKNKYYQQELALMKHAPKDYQILASAENRPFKGLSKKLWSGVDNPDHDLLLQLAADTAGYSGYAHYENKFVDGKIAQVPLELTLKIAEKKLPLKRLSKFQRQNALESFGNCLYFSVVTITSLGYGDISPNVWYTKIAASIEVICGLIIFVFAVNMLFANWDGQKKQK